jgi:NAD(P)-dependent dehydrogenase (short-subunit alcohol dehydrogenase family)
LLINRNIVYALDRLETPSPDFSRIQKRAESELGTSLHYRRIDVREVEELNKIVQDIADKHGRMDGLIAAAGIQQETPALEYSRKDCDTMMSINVTGVFMTAQAVARQMVRFEQGGSVVLIASMSGSVANRVRLPFSLVQSHTDFLRASFVLHTMLQRPQLSNWVAI